MNEKVKRLIESKGVSQGRLAKMDTHPRNLLAERTDATLSQELGSLLDCIMFTPEDFDSTFYQTNLQRPGDKMGEWLDAYLNYELDPDFKLNDTEEVILKARAISGYNSRLSDAVALGKFHVECDSFLGEMAKAGDRVIITRDEFDKAIAKQAKLYANEFTAPYFQDSEFQYEIYFTFEGIEFKGLLDGVIFDHKAKTIKPWDLKTTSDSVQSFEHDFLKWKYYIQAAIYRLGLKILFPKYNVLPFEFVIINEWEEPMIWKVDDLLHNLIMLGGTLRSGRKIKGIYQLIEDYKWYGKEKKYDYPAEFYRNGGFKTIDLL